MPLVAILDFDHLETDFDQSVDGRARSGLDVEKTVSENALFLRARVLVHPLLDDWQVCQFNSVAVAVELELKTGLRDAFEIIDWAEAEPLFRRDADVVENVVKGRVIRKLALALVAVFEGHAVLAELLSTHDKRTSALVDLCDPRDAHEDVQAFERTS